MNTMQGFLKLVLWGPASHPYPDAHSSTLFFLGRTVCCLPDEVIGFQGLCLEPEAGNSEAGSGWEGCGGARGGVQLQGQGADWPDNSAYFT